MYFLVKPIVSPTKQIVECDAKCNFTIESNPNAVFVSLMNEGRYKIRRQKRKKQGLIKKYLVFRMTKDFSIKLKSIRAVTMIIVIED